MKKLAPAIFAFAVLFLANTDAHAKRGIAIINTGENVAEIADIKDEAKAEIEATAGAGAKVGLMYSRFGLFWLDLWRWDESWVIVNGDNVWELDEAQATEIAAAPLSRPLTMTVPPGLIVLVLLIIGFVVFAVFFQDDEEEEALPDGDAEVA